MAVDHASVAAAITAGYKEIQLDRGASAPAATRHEVTLEKHVVGPVGQTNSRIRAFGQGSSLANAQAAALASLNAQRKHRYGFGSANTGKSPIAGETLTDDAH